MIDNTVDFVEGDLPGGGGRVRGREKVDSKRMLEHVGADGRPIERSGMERPDSKRVRGERRDSQRLKGERRDRKRLESKRQPAEAPAVERAASDRIQGDKSTPVAGPDPLGRTPAVSPEVLSKGVVAGAPSPSAAPEAVLGTGELAEKLAPLMKSLDLPPLPTPPTRRRPGSAGQDCTPAPPVSETPTAPSSKTPAPIEPVAAPRPSAPRPAPAPVPPSSKRRPSEAAVNTPVSSPLDP
ncbi:MAG: hypothetical protein ACRDD1_03015, partial [Planctomycetia bacterium]